MVSRQTKSARVATFDKQQQENAVSTRRDGERFLRSDKIDDEGNLVESYNTDNEERGFQSAAKLAAEKLAAQLGTKWKALTNKDFRNLQLFLNVKTSFEKLYKKGATPFKLMTEMNHNGIAKVGSIDERWGDYLKFWVKKNHGEI
ncbi:U-box domain-containing protein 12 [Phytophthora nicotianae]|nr:U-box domain-containing protein 12 [Phytophthora nicotianae]